MVHLFVQASKYLMIAYFLIYTFACFHVFQVKNDVKKQKRYYKLQEIVMYVFHFNAYLVLYATTLDPKIIGFYMMQVIWISFLIVMYHWVYKNISEQMLNNMCMLITIGFVILTRLSFERGFKHFIFVVFGSTIAFVIPLILKKISLFRSFTWVYAVVGIALLGYVAVLGNTSFGAKLSLSFFGVSVQPSEFVKIIFVFFIAGMLRTKTDFKQVVITSVISAIFVLALVASKDLGGALLYFFTYLVMIYVASKKLVYFLGGLGAIAGFSVVGYHLFDHVQTRVLAWSNPLSVIDNEGYQICQSLFAIGTGGWFGLGLNQGLPKKIPVVEKDMVFAAISEELGGIFAICLILLCASCFLMTINVAIKLKDSFYRLVALGLGTTYALQVFLTVGGVIKFIPSTGVTLPLVAYGGSSVVATLLLFGIIQALYIISSYEGKRKNVLADVKKGTKNAKKAKE